METKTQPETVYDVDYFIAKFEAIPEDKWCIDHMNDERGRHCVIGHCDFAKGGEVDALRGLFYPIKAFFHAMTERDGRLPNNGEVQVNDGFHPAFQQPTPRARILAALREIKAKNP